MTAVKKLVVNAIPSALSDAKATSFIEVQFPISKLSKESYKERKAVGGQTLTGLGKWWGRKPLILVRATILGCLFPASDDPTKDREIFLKILTMDREGLWKRKKKALPSALVFEKLDHSQRNRYFPASVSAKKPAYLGDITPVAKQEAERLAWERLSYDEKLDYCLRPEEIDGPSPEAWDEINAHLGTDATNIRELVRELGQRRYGAIPRVGDAFCGGGSVPFEAARIGCQSFGSDLNPVAAFLTWGALNVVGSTKKSAAQMRKFEEGVFAAVDAKISKWGIEHNEEGERGYNYLYCVEVTCPECHWTVPLVPTLVISQAHSVIGTLVKNPSQKTYDIAIHSEASTSDLADAAAGTVSKNGLRCPHCSAETPVRSLRGDRVTTDTDASGKASKNRVSGLRMWEADDVVPRKSDVFRERLYCIRWQTESGDRVYAAPTKSDLAREAKVLKLLKEQFATWQERGLIPSIEIESGDETDRLRRERGWTHWHHLFNPRQLLLIGLLAEEAANHPGSDSNLIVSTLFIGVVANFNSRLTRWFPRSGYSLDTFYNQALNTLFNYGARGLQFTRSLLLKPEGTASPIEAPHESVQTVDARVVDWKADVWITDPPYADAVNYHELSEFFLGWQASHIKRIRPDWSVQSRRAIAIKGREEGFLRGMIDAYSNLRRSSNPGAIHVVMFTHQDATVWADLATILWASGLQVVSAWCIATETESALKDGNYVKGTVLLMLKSRPGTNTAFLDELYPQVEDEVKKQVTSLLSIDDSDDPNFGDTDYQLAAYAAALRVLTSYSSIEDINIDDELKRKDKRESPITKVIENAVRIATEYIVPRGIEIVAWKKLSPAERLYLKGLEIEARGDCRDAVYQELARGFGVHQYKDLLASTKANHVRLRTPNEFARKDLDTPGFGNSLTRKILFAIYEARRSDGVVHGKNYLREEVLDYWNQRKLIAQVLDYLGSMSVKLAQWKEDGDIAKLLKGAIINDHV